ncbi:MULTISPECIES: long-chain fatty acid--CoA ligase [unclassified Nocardioides]|uniref:acyl-CoA synthetase n=1 Tax=unclassified Nocardioides TaxID=2615069 RepID=UPI0026662398|nr:long-chain fatty acid--CoA ligase [Nocardioides sp. Arc9.136]WKN49506.1 long-chain fatty acid--CoA ligase [Nocardioides sp. Arc9.136]
MHTTHHDSGLSRSRRLVLGEILARNARRAPARTAVVFEDASLTFAELDERTNRLANALADRGVGHGDKVAVLMYNRLEVVESFFACQKLGACPVPVNFRLAPSELAYVLEDSDAVALLTDGELTALALESTAGLDAVRLVATTGAPEGRAESYEELLASGSAAAPDVDVAEEDLAFLMYTSGTTGRPKGAMLTHQNLLSNTVNWILEMEARPGDSWLSGLPLFHIGGVNGLLPFIYLAGTCIITPSTGFDPEESLRLLERHRPSMCYFVPTQWQQICELPRAREIDTSNLRRALWGASQAPPSTLELLVATFPTVGIVNAFGQTEMSSNTCFLKADDAVRKMGSVGLPAVNVEVRIVDEVGRDVARGEVGEIVYRGPTVMKGYYKLPEATADAFRGGWFHSGDLVRQDDEGFIYVVDRVKDMIISGGENIYPAEVERAVERHPAVREVAVVGVPHPRWVETPVAVVVSKDEERPPAEEVLEFLRADLASYKKPSAVVYVDELPRNASGKVLKRTLRDSYWELFAATGQTE